MVGVVSAAAAVTAVTAAVTAVTAVTAGLNAALSDVDVDDVAWLCPAGSETLRVVIWTFAGSVVVLEWMN